MKAKERSLPTEELLAPRARASAPGALAGAPHVTNQALATAEHDGVSSRHSTAREGALMATLEAMSGASRLTAAARLTSEAEALRPDASVGRAPAPRPVDQQSSAHPDTSFTPAYRATPPPAAPHVHIGRVEVVVASQAQVRVSPTTTTARSNASFTSRRYLRNA